MRHHGHSSNHRQPTDEAFHQKNTANPFQNHWDVIRYLFPYLWQHRVQVLLAVLSLIGAKLSMVGVPIVLKYLVDSLNINNININLNNINLNNNNALFILTPMMGVVLYGGLRFSSSLLTELREFFFIKVTQSTLRTLSKATFVRLHELSLRFHLMRSTGQVTREIDHGVRGINNLVSYTLYNIVPTLIEFTLVLFYLAFNYAWEFSAIVLSSVLLYAVYTIQITQWRTHIRRVWNDLEAKAQQRAVDSLLNFETVKYFGNEGWEGERYDSVLKNSEAAAIRSHQALNVLNIGQQLIIAIALTLMIWRAVVGVQEGNMTVGDLVLVNTFLIQLYLPLNFLGVIYREMKQALIDIERLFMLLNAEREVQDDIDAKPLNLNNDNHHKTIHADLVFKDVCFAYDVDSKTQEPIRPIIQGLNLIIPAGTSCAVVGSSGAGKSTLARLLFRFYDIQSGSILINGQDIRCATQASVRNLIGIVPQDTVLFNDTILYNIAYGNPYASIDAIEVAAKAAHIHTFITSLPQGYQTVVGERGLKLSGGEKQRIAIARTILKNPAILILDEATSALDSHTEANIQLELKALSQDRTTLIIAHRLSTIVEADLIVVMEHGKVIEAGQFDALLAQEGAFFKLWTQQQHGDI